MAFLCSKSCSGKSQSDSVTPVFWGRNLDFGRGYHKVLFLQKYICRNKHLFLGQKLKSSLLCFQFPFELSVYYPWCIKMITNFNENDFSAMWPAIKCQAVDSRRKQFVITCLTCVQYNVTVTIHCKSFLQLGNVSSPSAWKTWVNWM